MRWSRPGAGLVPPGEFISVAEETGLIVPLGEWMLRRATLDCAGLQAVRPGLGVAVNVSAHQLNSGDFLPTVRAALADAQLAPELLTLEITESALLHNTDAVLRHLEEIRALGTRISLDDFGTGYSSLTYLHRLPINELKIDQSFVQTLGNDGSDRILLNTIIQLGRAYGLTVVAEGIDSEQKLRVLNKLGCRYGQGFLFARPAPLAEVEVGLHALSGLDRGVLPRPGRTRR